MEDISDLRGALPVLNVAAYVAVVVVAILGGQKVLNHNTLLDVYHAHTTSFSPADYAMLMWFLIFIVLGIFVIYQVLPAYRNTVLVQRIGFLFLLHSLGLLVWPFFWNYRVLWPSAIASLWSLATALAIYYRIGVDYSRKGLTRTVDSPAGLSQTPMTTHDFWVVQVPFSLVVGWLIPLTLLNIWVAAAYQPEADEGAALWTYQGWSALMLTLLTVIATGKLISRSDFLLSGVFAWFQFGVAVGHHSDAVIETAALVNGFLLLFATFLAAFFVGYRWFHIHRERMGYTEIMKS